MNREAKHVLGALAIALVLGVTYVMNFGLYPRFLTSSGMKRCDCMMGG